VAPAGEADAMSADADAFALDGRAKWIWSAEGISRPRPDAGPYRVRYFRRTFQAPRGASLTVHVSADTRYMLWCNGVLVCRGPAKGDVAHHFYETVDVSEQLRSGRNVLAAQVEYYGDIFCNYREGGAPVSLMTAAPGFVLDGAVRDAAGREIEGLHSDRRWRVLVDRAHRHQIEATYSHCVGMLEDFDCARHPWGFTQPDFDDSAWPAAREICDALRIENDHDTYMPHRLTPRMIALLEESPPRRFVRAFRSPTGEDLEAFSVMLSGRGDFTVPAGRQAVVLIDAGELTTGYPRLRFSGGSGATVALRYAEALMDETGRKSDRRDFAFGDVHGYCDILRPDGPERTYEPSFWRTFRFLRLEIATAAEPLTIRSLTYSFTAYPFEPLAEAVTSDGDTQAIWEVSWRTARLCAHETYEDCPYYEQLQYAGDTQVQAMVSYVVAGDASLARQFLYHFDWSRLPDGRTRSRYPSRVPQIIPLFSLHWVMSVHDYWMYTGDRAAVAELLPGARGVLDYFDRHLTDEGIVGKVSGWMFGDWCPQWLTDADPSGCPPGSREGRSAFVSLMTIAALDRAAELAAAVGEGPAEFTRRAGALRSAAHAVFYDERRGLYRDTPEGEIASRYTNAWAILAGMPCDRAALAERMVREEGLCSLTFFSTYFAWRALAVAGRYDLMGELLGPWRQMLQEGLTTWMEDPRGDRSDCHAWGCGPLVELTREILGVRPAEPGYAVIGIEPKPAGLTFARGRVPLTRMSGSEPARFVRVDWRIQNDRFILSADAPQGIPIRVKLPGEREKDFPGGAIDLDVAYDARGEGVRA